RTWHGTACCEVSVKSGVKTLLIWGVLLGIVFVAMLNRDRFGGIAAAPLTADAALPLIENGRIDSDRFRNRALLLTTRDGTSFSVQLPTNPSRLMQSLREAEVRYVPETQVSDYTNLAMYIIIPVLVLVGLLYFLRRTGQRGLGNLLEMRNTKARRIEN